jgi:phorbol esters/diacylglycerol binding protein
MHAESHAVISQVGFALLPAFVTFKAGMYPRLLLFFEGMLRGMLQEEKRLRDLAKDGVGGSSSEGLCKILYPFDFFLIPSLYIDHFAVVKPNADPPTVSIQVEPYEDTRTGLGDDTQSWISHSPYSGRSVPSQNASGQLLSSYRLLSLISPLLAVISDSILFNKASTFTVYRLRHMLDMIVDLRPDASLNVLETIAYHTPKARSTALSVLYSYWPRALGHCSITRPFESLAGADAPLSHHSHAHQFVLWRFTKPYIQSFSDGSILRECRSCLKHIVGLGLFCPLCICAVHFDCYDYPDGNLLVEYPVELDTGTQKVAVHRFCHVQPPTSDHKSTVQRILGHTFRVVNMFTLSNCFICKSPLWGCHSQGLKCDNCNHFVHAQCMAEPVLQQCLTASLTSAHTIISPSNLRNSFHNHFKGLLGLDPDSIRHHEEILICSDILWSQLQILDNGLALGSISIEGGDKASESFSLELQSLLERFRGALLSQTPTLSDMLSDFRDECRSSSRETLLFDWPTLVFFTASIKFVDEVPRPHAGHQHDPFLDTKSDNIMSQPQDYDAIPLGIIRDNLATNFQIYLDIAAETLLSQLYHVGLIEVPEVRLVETNNLLQHKESLCLFALPLNLDLSANVETLMTAIEACLSDIDLSVNEAGFLLLVRRVWPTEMSTHYALRRLMKSALDWILAEVGSFIYRI